jgi:hypothetical protein
MLEKLLIALGVICFLNAQPQDLLNEMYSFLEIQDPQFHSLLRTQQKSHEELKCSQNVLPRRKLKNRENVFDSGFESCGWEVGKISANCEGKALFDLQFQVRKVLFEKGVKNTNLISSANPSKSIDIPASRHISMIRLGFQNDGAFDYLSQIVIHLDDKSEQTLVCAPGQKFKRVSLNHLKRVDGFRASHINKKISHLDFYINKIALKNKASRGRWNLSYNELLKRFKIDRSRIEDKFVKRGPFGNTVGRIYEDPKFYGDWTVKEISVEVPNNESIGMISLSLVNELFMYDVTTPICGNKSPNPAHMKTVAVPANSYISWINVDLHPLNKKIRGLQFFYSNGEKSECLGFCMATNQRTAANSKDVYFSNKEHLVGFHGHETDKAIESIGFLISVERTENLAKYL